MIVSSVWGYMHFVGQNKFQLSLLTNIIKTPWPFSRSCTHAFIYQITYKKSWAIADLRTTDLYQLQLGMSVAFIIYHIPDAPIAYVLETHSTLRISVIFPVTTDISDVDILIG